MLKSIKQLLQKVLYRPSDIEMFVSSKNPKNAGDVEHWMRIYQHKGNW